MIIAGTEFISPSRLDHLTIKQIPHDKKTPARLSNNAMLRRDFHAREDKTCIQRFKEGGL